MRSRLGWTISYKSLYFVYSSLNLMSLFTGMRERSIAIFSWGYPVGESIPSTTLFHQIHVIWCRKYNWLVLSSTNSTELIDLLIPRSHSVLAVEMWVQCKVCFGWFYKQQFLWLLLLFISFFVVIYPLLACESPWVVCFSSYSFLALLANFVNKEMNEYNSTRYHWGFDWFISCEGLNKNSDHDWCFFTTISYLFTFSFIHLFIIFPIYCKILFVMIT